MSIPQRFPATGTDIGVSITRSVTLHRIGIRLSFDSRLDAGRLARATRLTLDAEPILGCRFVTDVSHPYWERLEDLDGRNAFAIVETGEPEAAMNAFQTEEIADDGPQAAVLLVRTPAGDEVGVKLSHVVADGQAVKQFAYLLADIYSRLADDATYVPAPNLRPRATASDVWSALTAEQRKAARKAAAYTMPNWTIPSRGESGGGRTYRTQSLAPHRFLALKEYGRRRDATVNDVMLTAVFRACVRAFDPPTGVALSLMSTADHRRFLADVASLPISNVSISGSLDMARVDGESFEDTLQRVRERMAAWRATSYGAAPARNAEMIARLPYKTAQRLMGMLFKMGKPGKTYPWYTNIGVLGGERLRFSGVAPVSAYMFGPFVKGASVVPTISTYDNTLTIAMGYCAADFDVAAVLDLLSDELALPAGA